MAKRKLNKSQIQVIALGALLALIAGVLVYVVSTGADLPSAGYTPKEVSTEISDDVFEHPVYRKLESPVALPIRPAPTGRDDPFQPF